MQLSIEYLDGSADRKEVPTPTREDIERELNALDWRRFASIQVTIDDDNWLNGSGRLDGETGLSIMLSHESVQHVSETAPDTPESMLPAFFAYLENDIARVMALLCDAERRGLSPEDVKQIHEQEAKSQKRDGSRLPFLGGCCVYLALALVILGCAGYFLRYVMEKHMPGGEYNLSIE